LAKLIEGLTGELLRIADTDYGRRRRDRPRWLTSAERCSRAAPFQSFAGSTPVGKVAAF